MQWHFLSRMRCRWKREESSVSDETSQTRMEAVIFKQSVKGSAYVCQGSRGEKAFKAKVLEGWGGKDVLGIEKPWQHEIVLHTQGSARNSHTWNMRGAEKAHGNWGSWKEVRGHWWYVGVVCSGFIYGLCAILDLSIWWWPLWWVFLFYYSSDIMTFPFSWSTMARSLRSLWAMQGKPVKDFRQRWDVTRIALSTARWITDWLEQSGRHGASTVNTWNILPNKGWI